MTGDASGQTGTTEATQSRVTDSGGGEPDGVATARASPDVEAAVTRIRDRGAAVRDRELETALSTLEARGDLSSTEREAVTALAERLVDRLLDVPVEQLREGSVEDSDAAVETALSLLG